MSDGNGIADKLVGGIRDAFFLPKPKPAPTPVVDPNWHNQQVQAANDSFKPQPAKPAPKAAPKSAPKAVPHYKHGTDYVPKTGPAVLHKGEAVLKKEDADEYREGKMAKHEKETVKLSHHRVVMHLNKGGLHRALGIPEGEKIPKERIQAAMNSKNEHVAKMAHLAHTMAGWHN